MEKKYLSSSLPQNHMVKYFANRTLSRKFLLQFLKRKFNIKKLNRLKTFKINILICIEFFEFL